MTDGWTDTTHHYITPYGGQAYYNNNDTWCHH